MAILSSIPVWRILWTEEPGGLQFTGSQRVRHNWVITHTDVRVLRWQHQSPVLGRAGPEVVFSSCISHCPCAALGYFGCATACVSLCSEFVVPWCLSDGLGGHLIWSDHFCSRIKRKSWSKGSCPFKLWLLEPSWPCEGSWPLLLVPAVKDALFCHCQSHRRHL